MQGANAIHTQFRAVVYGILHGEMPAESDLDDFSTGSKNMAIGSP